MCLGPCLPPSLAQRWFPGLECPFRHWEKHNKFVGKVIGKAGLGKEADFCPGVGGWAALGVHSWLSPTHLQHSFPGRRVQESFSGHLGRNGQQLAVPGSGSTGWVPGAHPRLCSVLEPLPSVLVSPNRNPSHLLRKPHLWVAGYLKKTQAVPVQHPEVFALSVGVAVWNSQQHTETQKGFLSWLLSHVASHLLKGQVGVGPSRIAPQAGSWAAEGQSK